MRFFSILLIICFCSYYSFSQNYLRVLNPKQSWQYDNGSIESAFLSVKPQGLFVEYGLYLTLSDKDIYFGSPGDSLEMEFKFTLPENAIVFESWLWIGDEISEGKIFDRWSASTIYEDIVKRKKDPSILFKNSKSNYELRVFPILPNSTRKVKLGFLLPANINASKYFASIPIDLVKTSKLPLNKLDVAVFPDSGFESPNLVDESNKNLNELYDPNFGKYYSLSIMNSEFDNSFKISYNSPVKNGYYLAKHGSQSEGIYELAILPSHFLESNNGKKIAICLDHDAGNSTFSKNQIINAAKTELLQNVNSKDSFNLFVSNVTIKKASDNWIPADSLSIENAFKLIGNSLANYSNMGSLLASAIDFINQKKDGGKIILVSGADQNGSILNSNQLSTDLINLMNPVIPVHIVATQNQNYTYNYVNGVYYYGNSYFFTNFSKLTGGSYQNILDGFNLPEMLSRSFDYVGGIISTFDLQTDLATGFCHSRYLVGTSSEAAYLNKPIIQIGKYQGDGDFEVEFSGLYNSSVFSFDLIGNDAKIITLDTLAREVWAGTYLQAQEAKPQNYLIINSILETSLKEKVLSIYTAFLSLEDTSYYCLNCVDESQITDISEFGTKDSLITAYPNPFSNELNIDFYLSNEMLSENVGVKIFDIQGKIIRHLTHVFSVDDEKFRVIWDGNNGVGEKCSSGLYLIEISTPEKRLITKVIKQ